MDRDSLPRLVADLGVAETGKLINPYACHDPDLDRTGGAEIRRTNLLTYLQARRSPRLLLVGEAPGYRGCRFSGIAFTSERSLPPERWSSKSERGWVEPSATIVHRELASLKLESQTILWNAVPFHPTIEGRPLTNRTPTAKEREGGGEWLSRLVSLIHPQLVVAVGRKAALTLEALDLDDLAVRHPANGGATLFQEQLRWIVRDHGLV